MSGSLGNAEQNRIIAEHVAETVINQFVSEHPEMREAKIPGPLKWAGAIVAGVMTVGIVTMAVWLVSSVSSMQVTLARMDERQISQSSTQESRFTDIDRRITKLETIQPEKGRP